MFVNELVWPSWPRASSFGAVVISSLARNYLTVIEVLTLVPYLTNAYLWLRGNSLQKFLLFKYIIFVLNDELGLWWREEDPLHISLGWPKLLPDIFVQCLLLVICCLNWQGCPWAEVTCRPTVFFLFLFFFVKQPLSLLLTWTQGDVCTRKIHYKEIIKTKEKAASMRESWDWME